MASKRTFLLSPCSCEFGIFSLFSDLEYHLTDTTRSPDEPLPPVQWLSNLTSPLHLLNPSTGVQNVVLSPLFAQTGKENEALHHYRTYFPTVSVTKNLVWSTHMVMLRYGSQTPMSMHLLIAASLMNLATNKNYDDSMCQAAREHARAGSHLLIESLNSGTEPDHIIILSSFFFLYKYMEKQKEPSPRGMAELSQAACNHVKLYALDSLSANLPPSPVSTKDITVAQIIHRDKRECLARLIVWLFYEDVAASVKGHGGSLAHYLCAKPEQIDEIYQQATTSLESAWGSDYPESEIIDDIENGPILRFLYEVMTLYTEVNNIYRSSFPLAADIDAVEGKIRRLGEVSRLTQTFCHLNMLLINI